MNNNIEFEQEKNTKHDTQLEFAITREYFRFIDGVWTLYPATVTVIDKTDGTVTLEEQGVMSKLRQAFDTLALWIGTGTAVDQSKRTYEVLSRNLTIEVSNSTEFYEGFQRINHNTISCHIDFLKIPNTGLSIVDYLSDMIELMC